MTAQRWSRGRGAARRRRALPVTQRADLAAYRWVARRRPSALDAVLPRLSRAANHSLLWTGLAAAMAATGGRFGRRAAVRGMLTLAATSAVVNLPAKLVARRARPVIDVVPEVRRLARLPASTSFPSGHSASAAAFATGVALEQPRLALPLGALAATVAASRVYTGVHYPGDVLAGAAIGAGIAWASRHVWAVTPPADEQQAPAETRADPLPLPAGEGLTFVVNSTAGPALAPDPVPALAKRLPAARIHQLDADSDLAEALRAQAAGAARALGVAGGDGTVNAAATAAHAAGMPLAVLPAGTLNHLARDLGVATAEDVGRAVEAGEGLAIDLATVGGITDPNGATADRLFCNVVCVGAYPALVDARERLRPRVGEWLALLGGLAQALRGADPVRLEIDGRACAVWLLFVGNCRYEQDGIAPAWRRRLDDGLLDVRIVDAGPRGARIRLLAAVATGTLARSPVYRRALQPTLRVRSLAGPMRVSLDGEVFDCAGGLTISKAAAPLIVYAPHR